MAMLSEQELRIVMIGKNSIDKTSLGNFMTGKQNRVFSRTTQQCVDTQGEWQGHKLTIVKMPNFLSLPVERVRLEMKKCAALCPPGPNVLLLLVKPSDFNEEDHRKLQLYLQFFEEDALKHSLVVFTGTEPGRGPSLNQLLRDCGQRQYQRCFDERGLQKLMEKTVSIVRENQGRHLTLMEDPDSMATLKSSHTPLNLLLCGTDGAEKTFLATAILGQRRSAQPTDSYSNAPRKGEVCGRQVSIVELPSLLGKAADSAKDESYRCVSLCEPEGIHAFVLVVALEYILDEDHRELEAIKNTFSSQADHITMVLFTTESDPNSRMVKFQKKNEDFQALSQSCGGRYVILNTNDMLQIPELLHVVDTMSALGSRAFTKDMILDLPMEVLTRQASLTEATGYKHPVQSCLQRAETTFSNPIRESLRIVLIGKTGCGKSATANCILGRKCFTSKSSPTSVTTACQKEVGEVDGQPVTVVDTPGLFDTKLSDEQIRRELMNCISMLAPGPHVFLLVLSIGRFTKEEKETVELIKTFFGERAGEFTVLMFTRRDELQDQSLTEYLQKGDDTLRKLMFECGNRYLAFNSTDIHNRGQVRVLLRTVEAMVNRNGGGYYTSDMFTEAERAIQKEMQKILKSKEGTIIRETRELEGQWEEEIEAKKATLLELTLRFEQEEAKYKTLVKEQEEQIRLEQQRSGRAREKRVEDKEDKNKHKGLGTLEREPKYSASIIKSNVNKMSLKASLKTRRRKDEAEKKRKEWWDSLGPHHKEAPDQEQLLLAQLIQEHKQQVQNYERKREEDGLRRLQAEREWREAQENYRRNMDQVKRKHEEEARKQAEESNEFRERYTRDMSAQREKHQHQVQQMRKQQERHNAHIVNQLTTRNKAFKKEFERLKKQQEEEIRNLKATICLNNKDQVEDILRELQLKHQDQTHDWIEEHVQMATTSGHCTIL